MMANYKRQPAYKAGENGKPKKVSPYDDAQRVLNKGYQCTEIKDTMTQIVDLGVQIFTIGQYLQPTRKHLKVEKYVSKEKFEEYKVFGKSIGFKIVESGPLVRSSYRADEQARTIFSNNE